MYRMLCRGVLLLTTLCRTQAHLPSTGDWNVPREHVKLNQQVVSALLMKTGRRRVTSFWKEYKCLYIYFCCNCRHMFDLAIYTKAIKSVKRNTGHSLDTYNVRTTNIATQYQCIISLFNVINLIFILMD